MALARAAAVAPLLLLPGALTAYLSFNSGGYFPGATSLVALLLAVVLLLRVMLATDPLQGLSVPVAVIAGLLMLYAIWTLASAAWSDSEARALLEFNRVLLYLFAVLLFGTLPRTTGRLRLALVGVAVGITAVCLVGFLTRTLPDVFSIAPAIHKERLSHPIGYWNALGLLAALAVLFCVHLTSSEREHPAARVFGAAALPLLASTLLFTYSRGAIVVAVLGALAYAVLARPHGLASGLIAAAGPTALALVASYQADLLASIKDPTTTAAAAQGHDVALVVATCAAAAAALRAACLPLDARLRRLRLRATVRRGLAVGAGAVVAVAAVWTWVGTNATDAVEAQYERATRPDVLQTQSFRDRLTDPGLARLDHWEIALDAFEAAPSKGRGAGTYALLWDRHRPTTSDSEEGHSLYLEVLGELGVIGLLLLGAALVVVVVGLAMRARGPDRHVYAALTVAALAWGVHAAIDWDWELPAVTLWLFALGALALAASPGEGTLRVPLRPLGRAVLAGGCVALAATPAFVAVSQARLVESVSALERGDCPKAVDEAGASIDALGVRPEPYEIISRCALRVRGSGPQAIRIMRRAVERDPGNWRYHYGLALARAANGRDPRRAAATALRLNPREQAVRNIVPRLRQTDPSAWRRVAAESGVRQR